MYFVYSTSLMRRNPSFRILMAAFWSWLIVRPQAHIILRLTKSFISVCNAPQRWQICDDGNHLSIFTRYLFLSDSLYSNKDKNISYPLSKVALPTPVITTRIPQSDFPVTKCQWFFNYFLLEINKKENV